jgi:hypothetical protein
MDLSHIDHSDGCVLVFGIFRVATNVLFYSLIDGNYQETYFLSNYAFYLCNLPIIILRCFNLRASELLEVIQIAHRFIVIVLFARHDAFVLALHLFVPI